MKRSLQRIIIGVLAITIVSLSLIAPVAHRNPNLGAQPQTVVPAASSPNLVLNATLHEIGATFPLPLIQNWTIQYHKQYSNITVYSAGGGSGKGQANVFNKTSDIGASDAPLNANQRILAPNILHIPETIGSVVPAYHLTGLPLPLNFTGDLLAAIFNGTVTLWNDPKIGNINPGDKSFLPNNSIQVVHRSDSSGTTFVWTSFLCLDSKTWCSTVGNGTTVNWPVGTGASGNPGVATFIINTANTLGYVELNFALTNNMNFGAVQNPKGVYVQANETNTNFAVTNSTKVFPTGIGDWSHVRMLNANGTRTYPIASFSYLLVYRELNVLPSMNTNETFQANALIRFLNWAITTGQTFSLGNHYVPLPPAVVAIDQASINSITYTKISAPASQTISLSSNTATGWNGANPGPNLQVVSGDSVTLNLLSSDSQPHQWFIDFNNNGVVDTNELNTTSLVFSSPTTATVFHFTPAIGINIPASGDFTYRDANNLANIGTIRVLPQQTAAVFKVPSTLTSSFSPVMDSSRVTTIGTILIDTRAQTLSGNVTVASVDMTSGSLTFTKTYTIPSLALTTGNGGVGLQLRFIMNLAVQPLALSSNVWIQYSTIFSPATHTFPATATVSSATRNVDLTGAGIVNIIDAGFLFVRFDLVVGNPNYDSRADFANHDVIDIIDAGIVEVNFDALAFS